MSGKRMCNQNGSQFKVLAESSRTQQVIIAHNLMFFFSFFIFLLLAYFSSTHFDSPHFCSSKFRRWHFLGSDISVSKWRCSLRVHLLSWSWQQFMAQANAFASLPFCPGSNYSIQHQPTSPRGSAECNFLCRLSWVHFLLFTYMYVGYISVIHNLVERQYIASYSFLVLNA